MIATKVATILAELNFAQQLVTPTSFERPNFQLAVKILHWLHAITSPEELRPEVEQRFARVRQRWDKYRVNNDTPPEPELVAYLKLIGLHFYRSLNVQLDLLKLYQADATSCCPELLKVLELVYEAAKLSQSYSRQKRTTNQELSYKSISELTNELRTHLLAGNQQDVDYQLAAELTALISCENEANQKRKRACGQEVDLRQVQVTLESSARRQLAEEIESFKVRNEELESDLASLSGRLGAKEAEVREAELKLQEVEASKSAAFVAAHRKLHLEYAEAHRKWATTYKTLVYVRSNCVYLNNNDNQLLLDADELAASKPSDEAEMGPEPEVLAGGANRDDEPLFVGDAGAAAAAATVGPAKLLESLFEAAGASKPKSASLATAGPSAPEGVGEFTGAGGAGAAVGAAVAASGAGERGAAAGPDAGLGDRLKARGRRYSGRGAAAAAGLELAGLLDEFALDEDEDEEVDVDVDEDSAGEGEAEDDVESDDAIGRK